MSAETDSLHDSHAQNRGVAIGAIASGVVAIVKMGIQLLLLPVMARLLGPDEFGLYSLVLPTVSLVALLADGGLGATLAREEESSTLIWSTAFWILLMMGVVLAAATTALGIGLGYMSHQPRLAPMMALLSISLIFLTLAVVPSARLDRQKRLGAIATADFISTICGAAIAVTLAALGAGAWSLALQYVSIFAIRAVLLNISSFHLPRMVFSFAVLRPHIVSGGVLIGTRMSEYGGRMAENFLVDRIFGTALLGNYTFANQITKYATDSAANVIWATLYVQALTGDREKIAVLHRRLCRLLAVLLFPATFLTAAAAPQLISFLLGPKWIDLSFFIRVLLPLYSFSVICAQAAPILLAYGRFEIQFWNMLGLTIGRIIAVISGLWLGIQGAAVGLIVVTLLSCLAMLTVPVKATGCRPLPMLALLVRPAISGVIATIAYFVLLQLTSPDIINVLLCLIGSSVVYLMSMYVIDRKEVLEDWTMAMRIMRAKRAKTA